MGCDVPAFRPANKPANPHPPSVAVAPADVAAQSVENAQAEQTGQFPTVPAENSAAGAKSSRPATWEPTGTWTVRRLIALVETGPCLIDLFVCVDGQSLELAAQEHQKLLAQELLEQLEPPATWEKLLDLPLVRSGWLGNLLPDESQREQVISLYDTRRDGIVDEDELPAFLSRGLARSGPLQIKDEGHAADYDPSQSPWGKADGNRDFALDAAERQQFLTAVGQLDVNADAVLTLAELLGENSATAMNSGAGNRSSMLRAVTLMTTELLPAGESSKEARRLSSELLRHYTFLPAVAREQWPDWSESHWKLLDENQNQQLDAGELQKSFECSPQVELYIAFPGSARANRVSKPVASDSRATAAAASELDLPAAVQVRLHDEAFSWQANATGGQLSGRRCNLRIVYQDGFSELGKQSVRQQLTQGLANPTIRTFLTERWQLGPMAFDLVDIDRDQQLSDDEFERVWNWLSSRQRARLLGQWSLATQPWILWADADADDRLSPRELQLWVAQFDQLDRNRDGQLTPNELPLAASLTLKRSDERLEIALPGSRSLVEPRLDGDWFDAMDTNQDGTISPAEFLGDSTDFNDWDRDQDRILSRGEVYFPKASK